MGREDDMPYTLTWEGTIEYVNTKCTVCGHKMKVEKEHWELLRPEEDGFTCYCQEPYPCMVIGDNPEEMMTVERVNIKCPLCGRKQTVDKKMWIFQSTVGHGYTCGSPICPSHTYMVIDE